MDDKNVVAARIGLPFKCGVCSQVHEKADLNNNDVCRCYKKAWEYALGYKTGWFSDNGDKLISKPRRNLIAPKFFDAPEIDRTYPIENDVFMLAFPVEKAANNLNKKFTDWENDCLEQAIKTIEERGKLKEVRIGGGGRLVINGHYDHVFRGYLLSLLMMKRREVAFALNLLLDSAILDVEWKSLKESAKLLVARRIFGKDRLTVFLSGSTGMATVPNEIDSVRKAEEFLLGLNPREKNVATLRTLFRMADLSIRNLIRDSLLDCGWNEHAERVGMLPPLDDSSTQYARALLEEILKSLEHEVDNEKYKPMRALEACLNALNALEKAYKSISNETSDDTIDENLSHALYWIMRVKEEANF